MYAVINGSVNCWTTIAYQCRWHRRRYRSKAVHMHCHLSQRTAGRFHALSVYLTQYAARSVHGTVSVSLSASLSHSPAQLRAAGLLLWAPLAGDIDRLLHGASAAGAAAFRSTSTAARRSAANASTVSCLQRRRKLNTDLLETYICWRLNLRWH